MGTAIQTANTQNTSESLPLVSILIFCKNAVNTIERSVKSVLSQDYPNIEYVVQDGASTDGTIDILEKYAPRFGTRMKLVSEPDKSVADGFHRALDRCKGSIIGSCLADEELLPDAVSLAVSKFREHPDAGVIHGDIYNTDLAGNILAENPADEFHLEGYLSHKISMHFSASFFRFDVFKKAGLFHHDWSDDFDAWCRLSIVTNIVHVPVIMAKYAISCNQLSERADMLPEKIEYRARFIEKFLKNDKVPENIRNRRVNILTAFYIWAIHSMVMKNRAGETKKYLDELQRLNNPPVAEKHGTTSKVLLLSLPGRSTGHEPLFPLGIGYLLAAVRMDRQAQAVHYQVFEHATRQLPEILSSYQPEIVGMTCSTFNRGNVRKICAWLRNHYPGIKIILGGVHVSFLPEQALRDYGADCVVVGEGERTFRELCTALDNDTPLADVRGIVFRDGERIVATEPREAVRNLDDLPMPDLSFAGDLMRRSGMGFVITSRGCPVRCHFCSTGSYWGQRVRVASPRRVVDEMESQVRKYGVRKIFFHDDTFNLGAKRVEEICDEISARNLNVEWGINCRVHPLSQELIDRMVAAGCRHICFGIESGSVRMLARINKKITREQIRRAYDLCQKHLGTISVGAFTMVGNFGECEETVAESARFIDTLPMTDPPSTAILYILPGTQLYEEIRGKHPEIDRYWVENDGVPQYTLEHPQVRLQQWSEAISRSGNLFPFDRNRHFWNDVLFGNIPAPSEPVIPFPDIGHRHGVSPESRTDLPVHFFTIVLNGEPFIRHHIDVFRALPFRWHWHVIEGVADLKHDTAWSLKNGGRITDELHREGISNDGTSGYLDALERRYPENITIYRNPPGVFWDGKLEMVNAPLPYIREECLLWQVDADELWTRDQIVAARELFSRMPEKTAAYYLCRFFVGEDTFITTRDTYGNHTAYEWLRTWRYRPGDRWTAHEPPRLCRQGKMGTLEDLAASDPFRHRDTEACGLIFQHYAYATEEQLKFKEIYYGYEGAAAKWRALQEAKSYPVLLRNYFDWVEDGAQVDRASSRGVSRIARRDPEGRWSFLASGAADPSPRGSGSILFVRTDAIGDTVLAASMLEHIAGKFPTARISVLCQDHISEIYEACPHVHSVIRFDRKRAQADAGYREEILGRLKASKFDLVLNSVYSREELNDYFSLGCGASGSVAHFGDLSNISPSSRERANRLYTGLVQSPGAGKTEMDHHRDFLSALGVCVERLEPTIWITPEDDLHAESVFRTTGMRREHTIALFPGAQEPPKVYERLGEVMEHLREYDCLVFGGTDSAGLGRQVTARIGNRRCTDLTGKTTIRQMIALIGKCRGYIGADSAGAHIACATGIPNVVVMGGGHFGRFFPYSPATSLVCLPMSCYGCNWKCHNPSTHCVRGVAPEAIAEAFRLTISKTTEKPRIFVPGVDAGIRLLRSHIDPERVNVIAPSHSVAVTH